MTQVHSNKALKSIVGIALMSAALGLTACSSPNPDVKARQDIMKNYGDSMKVMGGMVNLRTLGNILKTQKQLVMLPKPFGLIPMAFALSQRTSNK